MDKVKDTYDAKTRKDPTNLNTSHQMPIMRFQLDKQLW